MAVQPPPDKAPQPGLNIYGSSSVNPYKLTILCEELGLSYTYHILDQSVSEQKTLWFTTILNPNGRLPAIMHLQPDGTKVTVWESCACMMYIVSAFDNQCKLSFPAESREYWDMTAWLYWQASGLGPAMGQSCHFLRYASEEVPYGKERYLGEARRHLHVLDTHLSTRSYIVGEKLTIADLAVYPWVSVGLWCGIDVDVEFAAVKGWRERVEEREGVRRGMSVPTVLAYTDEKVRDPTMRKFHKMVESFGKRQMKEERERWAREPAKL